MLQLLNPKSQKPEASTSDRSPSTISIISENKPIRFSNSCRGKRVI